MPSARLMALLKLFQHREHADAFRCGRLWMNTIEHFRGCEDPAIALRGDPFEGVSALLQPSRLQVLQIGDVEISPDSMAAPVRISRDDVSYWNVFCMFSLNTSGCDEMVTSETLPLLKKALQLPEKCFEFGEHVVVVLNALEFQNRVAAAIRRTGMRGSMALVEYFNDSELHGALDPKQIPFYKPARYAYQREYRIVLQSPQQTGAPISLEIGDISDITTITTAREFNEQLQLRLPDGSRA